MEEDLDRIRIGWAGMMDGYCFGVVMDVEFVVAISAIL